MTIVNVDFGRLYAVAPVKNAVSGCVRNIAEGEHPLGSLLYAVVI